jgi:hypothetical protein
VLRRRVRRRAETGKSATSAGLLAGLEALQISLVMESAKAHNQSHATIPNPATVDTLSFVQNLGTLDSNLGTNGQINAAALSSHNILSMFEPDAQWSAFGGSMLAQSLLPDLRLLL